MTHEPDDILARFEDLCLRRPDAPLFTFVDRDGRDVDSLTAAQLRGSANALAAYLLGRAGLAPGDRAMLVYTPSLEFVRALLACLRAGIVPVPVAPPDPARAAQDLARLSAMAQSAGARALLGNREYARVRLLTRVQSGVRDFLRWRQPSWPDLPWITTDGLRETAPPPPLAPRAPDTLALLQYTSGSTAHPKGVMITHGNLAHQIACNARELGCGPDSVAVVWVPHFHDFGLISGILSALAGNGHLHLLSPLSFVERPALWFEVMSRVRATHTAAPNFAYELSVQKTTPAQRSRWDLSSLRVVMSAAEPVRAETVEAFVQAFAASRLRREAFCPAYGLAEHTVGVSVGGRAIVKVARSSLERSGEGAAVVRSAAADARTLVGCGRPSEGVRVEIVDEHTRRALGPGVVGELWVDSPSKALGYYGLPDETRATFHATLADDPGAGRFLRTGDLGFLLDGELFLTGRRKDLLILRGRNVYPEDLEASVRDAHPQVRPGGIAAFACELPDSPGGTLAERLVLFVEVRDRKLAASELAAVADAVRRRVAEDHQVRCAALVLGAPGLVRKTTSGKVQRGACRQAFLADGFARSEGVLHLATQDELPAAAAPSTAAPAPTPSTLPAPAQEDPRLADLDEDFRDLLADLAGFFRDSTDARRGRTFHQRATTLVGTLTVPEGLPAHALFAAGRAYPVLVRHANGVQSDDAAADNRGATLRVLDPRRPDAYEDGLLDLLLTTGECFVAATASDFAAWMKGGARHREQLAREHPHLADAAWGQFRRPSSYATLGYYSKVASRFVARDGGHWWARFRLVPDGAPVDDTPVAPTATLPPSEGLPRSPDDARPADFLHQELRARVRRGPVRYRLEVQLRPAAGEDEDDAALDATRPWPQDPFPFRPCGVLSLDTLADEARVEPLRFNPARAPAELGLALARSPRRCASLNHLRSIVYELAAERRGGAPLPPAWQALLRRRPRAARKRVVVVGAGASGLAAAFALRRRGHEVTVLERAESVAGKCASLIVDGLAFDWGGHVCTRSYARVAELVEAVGAPIEPATPTKLFDLADRAVVERPDAPALREQFLRYRALRESSLGALSEPGFATAPPALGMPAAEWFRREGLSALGEAIGLNFAASGYGYLADPSLPALYMLRAAETAGMLSAGTRADLPQAWTPAGGFGSFWERVAAAVGDVRCGVSVRAVERRDGGVRVLTDDAALEADAVLLAVPLGEALPLLDDEGRDLLREVKSHDYYTVAARASGLPTRGFYLVRQHCEALGKPGHCVAFHHRYEGSDVVLFYAFGGPAIDGDEVVRRLREDVSRMGGSLGEVLALRRWDYFAHAPAPDAVAFHARLAAWQGRGGTFLLGSVGDFELVECNVAYATALVERHFGPAGAAVPDEASPPAPGAAPGVEVAPDAPLEARVQSYTAYLQRVLADSLGMGARRPLPEATFEALGLDSLMSVELFQRLAVDTGLRLEPVAFLDHPSLAALARHLAERSMPAGSAATGAATDAAPTATRTTVGDTYTQLEDVVFGQAHGLALVMDVFVPREPNGLGVLDVASAQWESGRDVLEDHRQAGTYESFCRRGFTVFAVRPGSRSRFGVADMASHVQRATRYVRANAHRFAVDGERLGLLGGSAGGHIAALAAMTADDGDPSATDAVARAPSRVQALVAFCPPTDLGRGSLSYSQARLRLLREVLYGIPAAGVADEAAIDRDAEAASPLLRVPEAPPPTLLLHATADTVVPVGTSRAFVQALRDRGGVAELWERGGTDHRWAGMADDMHLAAEWMERALRPPAAAVTADPVSASASASAPAAEDTTRAGRWFLVPRPVERPALRLFAFPFAGGTADMYREWALHLPGDVQLCALSYPGRPPREDEPALTTMDALLDALEAAIVPLLDRPYALFGHSLGALTAFELARRLRRRGAPKPAHLFLSAFAAAQVVKARDAFGDRLRERALVAGAALMAPPTRADFEALQAWSYRDEPPLDMPLTVFGGRSDPMFAPADLQAWRAQTVGTFMLRLFEGAHRYLQDEVPAVVAAVVRALDAAVGDLPRPLRDLDLEGFAARWRATPAALSGGWNRFDLCWLARVAGPDGLPRFPSALARLRASPDLAREASHPYAAFVLSVACAHTLARWVGRAAEVTEAEVRAAIERACAACERPRGEAPRGWHAFPGFVGRVLVPAHECAGLLDRAGALVTTAQRATLGAHTSEARRRFAGTPEEAARYFAEDSLMLHFGEYFPAEALACEAARAHAARVRGLPGLTAACAARYLEVTDDPKALRALRTALERPEDGLRPGGRLQEVQFALGYLHAGGVDVRQHFAPEVEYVRSTLRADGVGVEEDTPAPDCDGTAVALALCHALGLPVATPVAVLERSWSDARGAYASADGQHAAAMSTVLHVLQATLEAADATQAQQRRVWSRSIGLLERTPWVEPHHRSPLFVLEKVLAVVGLHRDRFPDAPTDAPRLALLRVLEAQRPDGSFHGALPGQATVEETALGLLALRHALRAETNPALRSRARDAAARAHAWLRSPRPRSTHPDLWAAKLPYAPVHVIDALVLASLYAPLP